MIAFFTPLLLIEGVSRFFSAPASFDYIERRLIEQDFPGRKAKDEFRVFMIGESTIHGQYLFPNSTIARWMKIYLQHLLPPQTAENIKIYNLGRLGVDSFFIAQTVVDTIPLEPDLLVLYTSHNDFIQLENRIKNLNRTWKDRTYDGFINLIKKSAFISAMRRAAVKRRLEKRRRELRDVEEEDRWYDHLRRKDEPNLTQGLLVPGGKQSREILKMLENNVQRIIRIAVDNDIPVIFFGPLSRFDVYKPFASFHSKDLSEEQLLKWETIHASAEQLYERGEHEQACALYREALKLDKEYALTYFRVGQCAQREGHYWQAKRLFRQASERDYFPIRAPSAVYRFYGRLGSFVSNRVFVINTQKLFERHAPHKMIDISLVIDQLHPTMHGQALMAEEVCRIMDEKKLLKNSDKWQWANLPGFERLKQEIQMDDDSRFKALLVSAKYVGSYYEKAIEFLEQAVAIRPDSIAARSQLAWTLHTVGRREEAACLYRELERDAPKVAAWFFKNYPEFSPQR